MYNLCEDLKLFVMT